MRSANVANGIAKCNRRSLNGTKKLMTAAQLEILKMEHPQAHYCDCAELLLPINYRPRRLPIVDHFGSVARHDCAHIKARNAMIPQAETIANEITPKRK